MAAAKKNRRRTGNRKGQALRILKLAVLSQIVLFIFLVWIDEILDLPYILSGAAATPINWYEAVIESGYALVSGILVYLIISTINRKAAVDEQERKRQKIISDILLYESPSLFLAVNPDASILMASSSLLDKLGYELDDVIGKSYPTLFVPEQERGGVSQTIARTIESVNPVRTERHIVSRDGREYLVQWEVRAAYLENGEIDFIYGAGIDITEQKEAEASLRGTNERYRLLAENVIDVIWAVDREFRYTYISPSVEKMRGYTVEEAMNLPLNKMFTEKSYSLMMEIFSQAAARYEQGVASEPGRSKTFEAELVCKDGSTVWAEVTASYMFDANGRPAGFVGVTRDITERKRAEEEARTSREKLRNLHKHSQDVIELERARVAREIHDELGQVLTALKIDLSFLAKKLPPDLPALRTKIDLMLRFVDMTIQSVKRITMDLRPGLLDHLGLEAAIEWQAEEFQNRTGISYSLTVEPEAIKLNADQSTSIFRIFQETLTNIARHARATEVTVTLREKDGFLELTVSDNGIGISREQIEDPKSFGLMGIKERAYFSGGQAVIAGQKGTGTSVSVSIPLDQKRDFDDTSACG